MIKYLVAFISIALSAIAQYFFKVGVDRIKLSESNIVIAALKNCYIIGGLACYGISVIFWFYVISQMELSKAYPLVSLGYVFTALLGYFFLNENINAFRLIGIGLIIAGVIFISRS